MRIDGDVMEEFQTKRMALYNESTTMVVLFDGMTCSYEDRAHIQLQITILSISMPTPCENRWSCGGSSFQYGVVVRGV